MNNLCTNSKTNELIFDYRSLRLLMGVIALALPFVISLIAKSDLPSISFSYHTQARNAFVGSLFIVSSFLWAYNGHSLCESSASKVGSLDAILLAVSPTGSEVGVSNFVTTLHYVGAATLFSVLAYFCFIPFQRNTKGMPGKKGRRSIIYFICGCLMISSMLFIAFTTLFFDQQTSWDYRLTYWAEVIALFSFGIAWVVSGKSLNIIADQPEKLELLRR